MEVTRPNIKINEYKIEVEKNAGSRQGVSFITRPTDFTGPSFIKSYKKMVPFLDIKSLLFTDAWSWSGLCE